ncbi:uncharacterized protein LOC132715485 [Ruditapes philippinarum]|uniref:uncharacterized protein LOC132715485 n=1 Tax=Ruditapes philippinarum TaxID=129788 RepID=UPI00295B584B|nr:uncharacterized protein LOC132715485 [Ruditapes philippinarum]
MLWPLVFMGLVFVKLIFAHSCNNDSTLPRNLREQYIEWLAETAIHPSFQLLPGIFKQIGLQDKHAREMRGNLTHSFGNRRCSRTLKHNSDNLNDRSLCPYHFLLSHDLNRYPPIINTAKCTCSKVRYLQSNRRKCNCKGKSHSRKCRRTCNSKRAEKLLTPQCTEIPYRYKVLKQKYDENGNTICDERNSFLYERTYETVAIGCTPVLPKKDTESPNTRVVSEN